MFHTRKVDTFLGFRLVVRDPHIISAKCQALSHFGQRTGFGLNPNISLIIHQETISKKKLRFENKKDQEFQDFPQGLQAQVHVPEDVPLAAALGGLQPFPGERRGTGPATRKVRQVRGQAAGAGLGALAQGPQAAEQGQTQEEGQCQGRYESGSEQLPRARAGTNQPGKATKAAVPRGRGKSTNPVIMPCSSRTNRSTSRSSAISGTAKTPAKFSHAGTSTNPHVPCSCGPDTNLAFHRAGTIMVMPSHSGEIPYLAMPA